MQNDCRQQQQQFSTCRWQAQHQHKLLSVKSHLCVAVSDQCHSILSHDTRNQLGLSVLAYSQLHLCLQFVVKTSVLLGGLDQPVSLLDEVQGLCSQLHCFMVISNSKDCTAVVSIQQTLKPHLCNTD